MGQGRRAPERRGDRQALSAVSRVSIASLSACEVAYLSRRTVQDLTTKHPAITRALWWATLVDEGTLREWLVNMGRRPADQQMARGS